ncbi:MAG: hypothetical protein KGM47_18445, partial [Acidobacteriota bacterium]|nr:hypothetical protein [Acidobacteriota bacterium]
MTTQIIAHLWLVAYQGTASAVPFVDDQITAALAVAQGLKRLCDNCDSDTVAARAPDLLKNKDRRPEAAATTAVITPTL